MAGEWQSRAIGKAFAVNPPRTIKRGQVTPFIPMDALPEHARSPMRIDEREFTGSGVKFQNGDTLIARITPCLENGKTAFVSGLPEGVVAHGSTEYIILAGKLDESDNLFAYYLARSPNFRQYAIGHMEGTSGRQRVPSVAVENFTVTLPPLSEQRAIAHLLGSLDDKIELNRRMNETLEAIARAIFKSWFVDFDPVRAKASGEAPESICRRLRLTPDLLALFPDRLVDSELGEIPEGWEATTIEVATSKIFSGGTPDTRKAEYWDGELNWCSSGETRNRFIIETEKKITQSGVVNSSTKAVVPGDILIASAGQGHTRGQTAYCAIDTFINQSVVSVRTNTEKAQPHWLFYNLASRYEEMRGLSDSHSSRGSLTTKLIGGMSLILPTIKLVKAFDGIVGPLAEQQIKATQQSITLAAIRDTLLPKLLSGELRVQDGKTSDAMKGVAYG